MTAVRVVIPGVATRDLVAMITQLDDVIRELALIQMGVANGVGRPTVSQEVLAAMDRARPVLFEAKEAVSRQASAAWTAGAATVDIEVELPASSAGMVTEILDVLESVDAESAGDSALLLPAATPETAAFRRWFFTEIASSLGRVPHRA